MSKTHILAGLAGLSLLASGVGAVSAADQADARGDRDRTPVVKGELLPLNNSGADGNAKVKFRSSKKGKVRVHADGLAAGLPHAQHIHFGEEARNECPTAPDAGDDFRLTTVDGVPAYGPVVTSLTTRGDTSPDSTLAVDRFPVPERGEVDYKRKVTFDSKKVARAIRKGKGIVVIHGVDYNGNGQYDFDSAGASELNPDLPAEATDPAVCGVLR